MRPMIGMVQVLVSVVLMVSRAPAATQAGAAPARPPLEVKIHHAGARYQLHVDGQPYPIKGAGLESGSLEELANRGGNSFRTWSTRNGQALLDRALSNGLTVAMGISVGAERHGVDYNDPEFVARQLERIKREVLGLKDHPALLVWVIGNELNLSAKNPRVWDAVNDISRMIHEVDPNHPTMTTLAGINPELIQQIKTRAPDLDLIGIQMYADIVTLPRRLKECDWTGPYMVTEWGATGHWEVPKTSWGAPIENDSTTKAEAYRDRFENVIHGDTNQCLGSYVFLWGQKQERTPTWYGMFLESGEATATVDVMHEIWSGVPPANRSPALAGVWLNEQTALDNIRLKPGGVYKARANVDDPDGDPLAWSWEVMEESTDLKSGGDWESKPRTLRDQIQGVQGAEVRMIAPEKRGAYRLFLYVYDGRGHAAHANIPFFVEAPEPSRPAASSE